MAQLISITEAAERAGVARMTIWSWLNARKEHQRLQGHRIGHTWVVDADDLERAARDITPRRPRGVRKKLLAGNQPEGASSP